MPIPSLAQLADWQDTIARNLTSAFVECLLLTVVGVLLLCVGVWKGYVKRRLETRNEVARGWAAVFFGTLLNVGGLILIAGGLFSMLSLWH